MEKKPKIERIVEKGKRRVDAVYRAKKGQNEGGELADRYKLHDFRKR